MRRTVNLRRLVRAAFSGIAALLVVYLALLALWPTLSDSLPAALRWFGRPASGATIGITLVVLTVACALNFRSPGLDLKGVPVKIIAGLIATTLVLGLSSYGPCHDERHPAFFSALASTFSLFRGFIRQDVSVNGGLCPMPTPVALEVARLSALATIFVGVVGAAVVLFRAQADRLRAGLARSVTAVVGLDDDALAMVGALARTSADRRGTLVVITTTEEKVSASECRSRGASVVTVDFKRPETFESLRLWRRLKRLYLLSPDPSTNLLRLGLIDPLSGSGEKGRLPLTVRIDDPWQAEAWRSQHFGGSDTRWAADAVSKYEVTARRLLDQIIATKTVTRIVVCGTSPLTLALCADMSQRRVERDYYAATEAPALPTLTLVARNAEEYQQDHEFHQRQRRLTADQPPIAVIPETPSVRVLTELISGAEDVDDQATGTAVIFVDAGPGSGIDTTTGTRLAARFPAMPVYAWDPISRVSEERLPIVGQLITYRLAMDVPTGQAHDAWERAAMLIHDRYVADTGRDTRATWPWVQLDGFYRGSNRRQVRNALWMVEQIGGHTWNSWDGPALAAPSAPEPAGLEPLERLSRLGFSPEAAMAMARAEHEDWCRFYRKEGWRYGPARDDDRKIHDKLVDWPTIEADPVLLRTALNSLAATLQSLRELGYRSRPTWTEFDRVGTVIAEQRPAAWTWTTRSGDTLRAGAGDWAVRDPDGDSWSVRDDIFRATYEQVDGQHWRRRGAVLARPARTAEIIDTLEGPATAADGDWVVQGVRGEQWPVPADQFARRYRRAGSPSDSRSPR
jgi:hypothetical protein